MRVALLGLPCMCFPACWLRCMLWFSLPCMCCPAYWLRCMLWLGLPCRCCPAWLRRMLWLCLRCRLCPACRLRCSGVCYGLAYLVGVALLVGCGAVVYAMAWPTLYVLPCLLAAVQWCLLWLCQRCRCCPACWLRCSGVCCGLDYLVGVALLVDRGVCYGLVYLVGIALLVGCGAVVYTWSCSRPRHRQGRA